MMLSDILKTIVDKLNADPWLQQHHWQAAREDDGEIVNTINASLTSVGEGCLIVVSIGVYNSNTTSSKRPDGMLNVVISCMEAPALNRPRNDLATALHVAEHVAISLNLEGVGNDTLTKPTLQLVPVATGVITYNVGFDLHHVLQGT